MTARRWQAAASVVALVGAVAGGVLTVESRYARSADVERVEQQVAEGLDAVLEKVNSERCQTWLSELTSLEQRQASGELSSSQRDRLIWLRNQYRAKCAGGNNG